LQEGSELSREARRAGEFEGSRRREESRDHDQERRGEEKREDNGSASADLQQTGVSTPASHTAGDKVALILDHESAHE
jgi:hypothetical protein